MATFAEPSGLYRHKRLLIDVNMATGKFQHIIWQILKDCPGTHNIHDDIRVVGNGARGHMLNGKGALLKKMLSKDSKGN